MTVASKIIELAAEQAGLDEQDVLAENTFNEIGFDDLDIIEFVMSVEDEYDLNLTAEETESLTCIQDMINHVTEHI